MRKTFISLIFLAFLAFSANSQTVLISPAGDGGFETGTDFALNGWTTSNSAVNPWTVGTAIGTAPFVNRSAYISNDAGVTNAYTNSAASLSYFYRDITVPAGESIIKLSFNWVCNGESIWDLMQVFTAATTVTPTGGTTYPGSGLANIPADITGATFVGSTNLQTTIQTATFYLPASLAGTTFRLIFAWKNDGGGGSNPSASVDNISLTSMMPSPLHGLYTINNLAPTTATLLHNGTDNFNNFTAAINALNDNGVSGPVTLAVVDGQTFTEDCPIINATGTSTNTITFTKSGSGVNPVLRPIGGAGTADAGITINGGDYFIFNGIDINIASGSAVENGYLITNASGTNGAMNNIIANCKITLNRANTSARGIYISHPAAATNATGANSYTTIHKNTIENSYHGIVLTGTSAYPDLGCVVDSNIVGAAAANDIGNGGSASNGIRASYQNGITVAANTVRNVTTTAAAVYGIYLEGAQGTNYVFNNKVYSIGTTSTATGNVVYGIRTDINATYTTNVFNNMVSDLNHGIVTASATQVIRAIAVGISGTGTGNFAYNSVSINENAAPSSTAFYINGGTANLVNNVFANYSTAGATSARYCIYRGAGTIVSGYNDLYIDNAGTNNYVGYFTVNQATLAAWQVGSGGQDLTSISVDPTFASLTDLHTTAAALNGTGTPVALITIDIDGDARDAMFPDMGADENLVPPTFTCVMPAPGNTVSSDNNLCNGESIILSLQTPTPGTGVGYQWQSSTDGITYTNIAGGTNMINAQTPNAITFYQCIVTCYNGPLADTSAPVQILFANEITSTTDGSRCGTGSVDLDATANVGATINWYSAATGGTAIGTGSPWTTPAIASTTNYYVAAEAVTTSNITLGAGALSGSSNPYCPFNGGYGGEKAQYLIRASELISAGVTAGNINSVTFYATVIGTTYNGFYVEMGSTALNDFTSTANIQGSLTTVYSAASITPVVGANTITFSTPFLWDGTSNIILSTSWSNNNASNTSLTVTYDNATFYASQCYRKDNETSANLFAFTGATGAGTYSFSSTQNRPRLTFNAATICSSPRIEVVATVVDAPAITLTPSATIICDGDSLDLNVSSTNLDYVYNWSAGTTPATGTDVVAAPSVNTTYTVTASDNSGGAYDGCALTADVNITVNPSPTAVSATSSDNDICVGSAIDLSSSSVSGDTYVDTIFAESFENAGAIPSGWSENLDVDGNATSATLSYVSSSSYPTGFSAYEGTYFVRFNSFSVQTGNSARLMNTTGFSTNGMSNIVVNFAWTQDDGYTNNDNVTVEYSLDGTTWNAAGASITRASASGDNWTLQSVTLPAAAENQSVVYIAFLFTSAYGNDCHIDYVNVSANVPAAASFAWTSVPAGFASNSQDTAGVIPAATTEYIVTAGNSYGCYTSASTTVNVNAYPVVDLGGNQAICDTTSITLNAGNPGSTYDWSTGGTNQTEVFDGSVGAGSYDVSVEVTNAAGCASSDTVTITVTVCDGINDPSVSIAIYPNPANDQINLDLSQLAAGDYTFELLSLQGQQIVSQSIINGGGIISIGLIQVAPGTYIVRVSGSNNSFQSFLSIE